MKLNGRKIAPVGVSFSWR